MSDNPITVRFVTDTASGHGSKNTRLLVDGQDIAPHCRAVTMLSRVGGVNEVVVELLPRHGMAFDLPVAVVTLEMSPLTGYRIVSETRGDRVHYWTEPEEPRVMIIPEPTPSATLTRLRELAKEATNGWACYARTNMEHAEIARLHHEIDSVAP